jgi:glycosyltransferase involved in cell wall biosynthesis
VDEIAVGVRKANLFGGKSELTLVSWMKASHRGSNANPRTVNTEARPVQGYNECRNRGEGKPGELMRSEYMAEVASQPMKHILIMTTTQMSMTSFNKGFAQYLVNRGLQVSVASLSDGGLDKWARTEGAIAYTVPFARRVNLLADLRALCVCWRLINRIKPDIVVAATPKAGLLGSMAACIEQVPVRIYELWGLRLETEQGLKRLVLSICERVAMSCATDVIANSSSLALAAQKLLGYKQKHITVLGRGSSHGVDVDRFRSEYSGDTPNRLINFLSASTDALKVGFIGRITADKGITTLLRAIDICRGEFGSEVRVIIVGRDEDSKLSETIDAYVDSGIAYREREVADVRPFLSALDVLCLPSLREGFPNVVLEAASMGIPSIVSSATGAVDSVVDAETGWIFPVRDHRALAIRLAWLLKNREQIRLAGGRALKRVRMEYRREQVWQLKYNSYVRHFTQGNIPADGDCRQARN